MINAINDFLWGTPLLAAVFIVGIFFTVASGFFQFTKFGEIFKSTIGSLSKKSDDGDAKGIQSPLKAMFSALGGTIGVGSIAGCSTSIALGGPGAMFWIWFAGLLGMIIKTAEVSLALYYRKTDNEGNAYGGPTYYMERGLGIEKGFKAWPIVAVLFGGGIFMAFFITSQNYSVAEAIESTFGIPLFYGGLGYALILYALTFGGIKYIGGVLSFLSPFKIGLYVLGGLGIIIVNFGNLPATFGSIFKYAFTPHAALGGFAGVAIMQTISRGFARMVYSTEAGWGTSPMVHATAATDHPIRQGLWGAVEVFLATFVTMTITGIAILSTGLWSSGDIGSTLALSAFESVYGWTGRAVITFCIFLFGITVSTGWAVYYEVLLRHAFGDDSKIKSTVLKIYRITYPLPGLGMVVLAAFFSMPGSTVWALVDIATAIPTFVNLIVILFLSKTFIKLIKDYSARYLGIGTVDPNMKIFYEDELK